MRILKRLILIAFCITGIVLLQYCTKSGSEDQKYMGNYPLGEVKDYLYFKPGSYWVYECDSTLEIDSQVMIKIDTPWIRKSYIDYQSLSYTRHSYSFNTSYSAYESSDDIFYRKFFQYGFSTVIAQSGPSNSALDCLFFYPFDSAIIGAGGSSGTYYKGHLDYLDVLGVRYNDVRIFQYTSTGFPKLKSVGLARGARITVYWAKRIGIIRMYVEGGKADNVTPYWHNWNLKRYKIK